MNNENALTIFAYEGRNVRTVAIDNEPWWVGKDICEVFGEKNRNRAMSTLDDDEKGYTQIDTPGGKQKIAIVNESGLYSLLFAMQPEKARGVTDEYIAERQAALKKFKRWVTHEVLPTIRKTGGYGTAYPPKASSISEIVQFGRFIRQLMKDQNATPYQIAEVVIAGIRKIGVDFPQQALLPLNSSNLDKVRDDELDMVEFAYTFPNSTYQDYLLYRSMIKNSR